jgi:hypothetical protein
MLNCKNATRLISESQERSLLVREKMPLKIHLMMCSACNNFKLQMPFLSQAMRSFAKWEGDAAANTQVAIPKQDKQDKQDK